MYSFILHFMVLLSVILTICPQGKAEGNSETPAWQVTVDFENPVKPMDPAYASANVNAPLRMLEHNKAFDDAVKTLGFRMMRFQGPGKRWDYHKAAEYTDEDFKELDEAVEKARSAWGVRELMFGIHRVKLPVDEDGRYLSEDFPAYADMCARFVKRYAPPGNVRVRYWEPFNEQEHAKKLDRLKKYKQGMEVITQWYVTCAKAMKAINPEIFVGGPSMCDANTPCLKTFLQEAKNLVDFVSWHDYSTGSADSSDDDIFRNIVGQSVIDKSIVGQSVIGRKRFVGGARNLQNVMDSLQCGKLPLFLDEYHVNYRAWNPPDVRTANQLGAVFAGSVLANMSNSPVNRMFIHDVLSAHYGLIGPVSKDRFREKSGVVTDKTSRDALHVRPMGWVFRWFNQYAGGQWVQCRIDVPQTDLDTPRGRLLDACAWRNGSKKNILLVNKDTSPHDVLIRPGASIPSDGFALPLREMSIVNGVPREIRTTGTKQDAILRLLPPMSVAFIVIDEITSNKGGSGG